MPISIVLLGFFLRLGLILPLLVQLASHNRAITQRAELQAQGDALLETRKGKTALLITHRFIGLENRDEILVMEHGTIVERGTHVELLNRAGLYRRLWDLQNQTLEEPAG